MSKNSIDKDIPLGSPITDAVRNLREQHKQQAEVLLNAYHNGDPYAIEQFKRRVSGAELTNFEPTLLQARMLVSSNSLKVKKLSLEKLKKNAKDLLKALKIGDSNAIKRLAIHHSKLPSDIKLADAQLIIARENGFESWAKAKHHISQLYEAEQRINHPTALDSDLKTLHIRCGNDIKNALETCGFTGEFLEVSNPFPIGPVPHFFPVEHFIRVRSDFLRKQFSDGVPQERIENVGAELHNEETTLASLPGRYKRVVLWFEHDSFDQLCKAYVLAHLALHNLKDVVVECVQIDAFPGLQKFIGIGQIVAQEPEAIFLLWPQRKPVSDALLASGKKCWEAFTSNDPTQLWHLMQKTNFVCEIMRNAIHRTLQELPWVTNGLSLTEYLSLEILANEGPMRPGAIFNLLMTESDPLPYLGDLMLVSILRPLWEARKPAIEVIEHYPDEHPMRQTMLGITELGKALLEGERHWLKINKDDPTIERHVGGVTIKAGKSNWYWHPVEQKPVWIDA